MTLKVNIRDFHVIADAMRKDRDKVIRSSLIDLSTAIIKDTPVGDPDLWQSKPPRGYVGGTLRGAWNASTGSPNLSINTRRKSKTGTAVIGRMRKGVKAFNPMTETLYFVNPMPYAARIEYQGWSTQAPEGMVRSNVLKLRNFVQRRINELR